MEKIECKTGQKKKKKKKEHQAQEMFEHNKGVITVRKFKFLFHN